MRSNNISIGYFFQAILCQILLVICMGCATTNINEIITNPISVKDKRVSIEGIVIKHASNELMNQFFDMMSFTFSSKTSKLPKNNYYFLIKDISGAIWVVTSTPSPQIGANVKISGTVKEVINLPIPGSANRIIDIDGWKTPIPPEVKGNFIVVQ